MYLSMHLECTDVSANAWTGVSVHSSGRVAWTSASSHRYLPKSAASYPSQQSLLAQILFPGWRVFSFSFVCTFFFSPTFPVFVPPYVSSSFSTDSLHYPSQQSFFSTDSVYVFESLFSLAVQVRSLF